MAELLPKERLQPSLLDRLSDNDPKKKQESRGQRVLSLQKLRESVRRDVSWLLNTTNLAATDDLPYPPVVQSVLNFGIPELTGLTAASIDVSVLERALRKAIRDFEPRLLRNSVKVQVSVDESQMNHNVITFDIEGELWAQPAPTHLLLKTKLDLENGDVTVKEYVR